MKNFSLITFILLIFISINSSALSNRIVANVSGEIITEFDVKNRYEFMRFIDKSYSREEILRQLIDEKLYILEAKRSKIEASEMDVMRLKKRIEESDKINKDFDQFLATNKLNKKTAYDHLKAQTLWTKILSQKIRPFISVSNSEIDEVVETFGLKNYTVTIREVTIPKVNNVPLSFHSLDKLLHSLNGCSSIYDISNIHKIEYQQKTSSVELEKLPEQIRLMLAKIPLGYFAPLMEGKESYSTLMICDKEPSTSSFAEKEKLEEMIFQRKMMQNGELFLKNLRNKYFVETY